jgi:hypothetical protein
MNGVIEQGNVKSGFGGYFGAVTHTRERVRHTLANVLGTHAGTC